MMAARRSLVLVLVLGAMWLPSAVDAKGRGAEKVVGEDAAGDWGDGAGPVGTASGQDLITASIVMKERSTIEFVFGLAALPPVGELTQANSYTWDMTVDDNWWRLTSFVCDPSSDQPETCAPGTLMEFELLECGQARTVNLFANCAPVAAFASTVDTGAATITVPVSSEALGIKPGSRIGPLAGFPWGAFTSSLPNPNTPRDALTITKTFVVPALKEGSS